MLTRRRRRAKDRLTWTEIIRITDKADEAAIAEWSVLVGSNPVGFEQALREIERHAQPYAPPDGTDPDEYTDAWYAREILRGISRARSALASGSREVLAYTVLRLGHHYGAWRIRRAFGPAAQYVRKVKANRLRAGRRRGRDVHADASERDKQIIDLRNRLRRKYPYDAEHSTRWLAREIASRLSRKLGTIRDRLAALGLQ